MSAPIHVQVLPPATRGVALRPAMIFMKSFNFPRQQDDVNRLFQDPVPEENELR